MRIESRIPLHYKLVDVSGNAAVVEFIDGKRVVTQGDELAYPVLANSTYADSLDYLDTVGQAMIPLGSGSLQRFARAAARAKGSAEADPINLAFDTLASVAQPGRTRWSVVFDPKNLAVHWRFDENRAIRSTKLSDFDLSCRSPVNLLGVHEEGEGEEAVENFRDYSHAEHQALIRASYTETPFLGHPDEATIIRAAAFAESSVCEE
jgi:penicillin V acylase-like amidase (Ntn superfamily)